MPGKPFMSTLQIEHALRRVGEVLQVDYDVEVLIVDGAAGMLTGVFPPGRTTIDCDVMLYLPPRALAPVELAAEAVAAELGLSPDWLNSKVQIRADSLPADWRRRRRIWVGTWGRLTVHAASRSDLLAMKILAGRARDIEDIYSMRPRADDVEFIHRFLDQLPEQGTPPDQIDRARSLLESLELTDHE